MSVYGEGQYVNPRTGESGLAPPPRSLEQMQRHEWELLSADAGPLDPEATAETKPLAPQSVYAIGKRDQEELSLTVGTAYGIPTIALRLFNTYGPRQALTNPYTGAVAIFATRLRNGRAPIVFEDGRQTRDCVHVTDVARAFATALESSAADGRVLNVGTGSAISVASLATTIAETLGSSIEPEILGEFRPGDVRHCYADVRLARELVGFEAEISLEDGIPDVVEWIGETTPDDHADAALAELVTRGLISE
jgi:dTDP-L-rhamnose 4-epimerase